MRSGYVSFDAFKEAYNLPAAICTSDVARKDLSSSSDFSAAFTC